MTKKLQTIILAALLSLAAAAVAFAQLDPGMYVITIWQETRPAGIIYVPERPQGTNVYAEHWILFPNYVDPSGANGVATELIPSRDLSFRSEVDFFRGTPWGPGYRYLRTLSYDTTMLPGR